MGFRKARRGGKKKEERPGVSYRDVGSFLTVLIDFVSFVSRREENTPYNEPSFVGLLFPNVSTIFWIVTIQCGLL